LVRISRRDAKRNAESAEKDNHMDRTMDRISRRDAKRNAESAEKKNEILLLFFFALSAFLSASLRETACHFASLRETACHFESMLSQPLRINPSAAIKRWPSFAKSGGNASIGPGGGLAQGLSGKSQPVEIGKLGASATRTKTRPVRDVVG
jgi:hypothetical protein